MFIDLSNIHVEMASLERKQAIGKLLPFLEGKKIVNAEISDEIVRIVVRLHFDDCSVCEIGRTYGEV